MTRGKNIKRRPWPPKKADLEALIEEAIVDAYGESEQRTGFYTMIEEHLGVPFETEILGVAATVERIDMNHHQEPWKLPLPAFIEELYFKRKERPDVVLSIEERARIQPAKKAARKEAKQ